MLKTVTAITRKYPATFFTGFIGLVVGAGMSAWLIATIVGLFNWSQIYTQTQGATYALLVFCIFVFYWTSQVITNSVHLTVSGVWFLLISAFCNVLLHGHLQWSNC